MPDRSYAEGINTQRIALAANLTTMGVSSVGTESLTDLVAKVLTVSDDADALAGEIVSGKTAYVDGAKVTGTMPDKEGDNACSSSSVDGTTLKLVAPTGFYDGTDTVTITDADFIGANIADGVEIFGVTGTLVGDAATVQYTHVSLTNNQDIGTTYDVVSWESEDHDDLGAWSSGSPTRLTVPAGVTSVEIVAHTACPNAGSGNRQLKIVKGGSTTVSETIAIAARNESGIFISSGIISVAESDYFEIYALASDGADMLGVSFGGPAWAEMRVVTGQPRKCIAGLSSTYSYSSGWVDVSWERIVSGDVSAWSSGSATRLTVPSGFTDARVWLQLIIANGVSFGSNATIMKNGTGNPVAFASRNSSGTVLSMETGWMAVSSGDYFTAHFIGQVSGMNLYGDNEMFQGCRFGIELI